MKLKTYARENRKTMPKAEKILWGYIRKDQLGFRFYRQKIVGKYIVDFYCPKLKLIIELDGEQHNESSVYDQERDRFLRKRGYRIIRYWNGEIEDNVFRIIDDINNLYESNPPLTPPLDHKVGENLISENKENM